MMSHLGSSGRWAGGLVALTVTAASTLAAITTVAGPAAAAERPEPATAADRPTPGDACTSADLGMRHPYLKTTEVSPTITHFKGWYVTEGTTGSHEVTTSTETTITVSVGLEGKVEGGFAVALLESAGASLGLNVQVEYSSTSTESNSVTWNFNEPGYYGVYKGTKKVTGTYGSLHCNRAQQGDGSWALQWIEGSGSGSFTTYTTLEEGAVRCEDAVPPGSVMARAQGFLDCGSAAAQAEHPAGAVTPTAEQLRERSMQGPALAGGTSAEQPEANGHGTQAALDCQTTVYKIAVPGQPLSWGAPVLANDGVRLRPSTIFSAHLDHWRLCNVTETNGVLEASLWNWGNGGCATIAEPEAADERAILRTATCTEDDLQRFFIYRDVPGSSLVGVQNKYTGSMMGHDRYADGEFIRQYSGGRQDGTGTYSLIED